MSKTEYFENAISFALNVAQVKHAIQERETDGYSPIGVNMRLRYSQSLNQYFVQINFDFYKNHQNQNINEDIVVWLRRTANGYQFYSLQHVNEVPDGLGS